MKEMQVFQNPEFGKLRTVEIDGEPWLVGKDVCAMFGDKNHNRSLGRVDFEDKMAVPITDSMGRTQQITIINESGLYALLFAMQPQKANNGGVSDAYPIEIQERIDKLRKFKRWVTSEVLPSIRHTGGYISGQAEMSPEELMAKALAVANEVLARREAQISSLTVQNQILSPKADYFDQLVERNTLTNFRETAKEFGVSPKKFVGFLLDKKYIYRDQKGKLLPCEIRNDGLFEVKECYNEKTKWSGTQTLITPKGRETFRLLFMI